MELKDKLIQKIESSEVVVGIIGLGYVGLPLAVSFANQGIEVVGFEKSEEKVAKVNAAENYIGDVKDDELQKVVEMGLLKATLDFSILDLCDAILICVPTPLDLFKKPDMKYIQDACEEIGRYMTKGTFVCLESTTYPTTTEDFMLPILGNASGLKQGKDFWLAFSPERVDPGNKLFVTKNTPKVLGAMTPEGSEIGEKLYKRAIDSIHIVSSPKVAEMVKILENTYRLVNISLVNELALLSGKMGINIWEVIDAAKTKPYGFQAFYPGPGIGGHCIPLDPFYLEHIAKKFQFDLTMIHTAGHIDMLMPHRMSIKINSALNRVQKSINGSKILFLGVAYKPNIADERESPALKIIDEVINKKAVVSYHDPYIPDITTQSGHSLHSVKYDEKTLQEADCVVITTNHDFYQPRFIRENAQIIVDLRNMFAEASDQIYKL